MSKSNKALELEKLKKKVLAADLPLKKSATNLVFGKGNPNAEILIIGEAPGKNEDLAGLPFVGAAGKHLDSLLGLIDMTMESVYIANILKYRPPNNRPPAFTEIKAHTPFLIEQIKIIQPKLIVTLGNFATKFILAKLDCEQMSKIQGITQVHAKVHKVHLDHMELTVLPLFHPAACLYNNSLRKSLEHGFKKIPAVFKTLRAVI